MTEYFATLSAEDFEKVKNAVPLIAVLIAGADGEINEDELHWAEKVTKIRSYKMSDNLKGFYQEVGIDFAQKLSEYINDFPNSSEDRIRIISDRLAQLNPILAKLEPKVGSDLYHSFKSFAKHVASSDGGFLGFFAIGPKEKELIELKMITPIIYEADN